MGSLFWKYNFAYVYVPNVESGGRVSLAWSCLAFSCIAQRGRCTVSATSDTLSKQCGQGGIRAMPCSVLQLWMDMFDHIMVGLFFFQIIMTGE